MSQCVSCSNQPNTNDSLGGAAHEGTVTPMVIGIIVGTVIVFLIVVCALFYCVKLENHKHMAKVEEDGESEPPSSSGGNGGGGGGGGGGDQHVGEQQQQPEEIPGLLHMREIGRDMSVKSRPSSLITQVVVVPQSPEVGQEAESGAGGPGKKRSMFGWGKKRSSGSKWCSPSLWTNLGHILTFFPALVPLADNTPVTAIEMF